MTDSQTTAPETAPVVDTPPPAQGDPVPATTQAQPVVDPRSTPEYKALQAEYTRKAQLAADLERKLAARQPSPPPEGGDTEEDPRISAYETQIAESVFGPEVMDAYSKSAAMLDPRKPLQDHVAAFEAYHAARSRPASTAQAAATAQTQAAAVQAAVAPRVDSNRQDPDLDLTAQIEAAKRDPEKVGMGGFIALMSKAARRG